LAVDKQGLLVLIENKLDDTGRDVTWQALKYASYCSRLRADDIYKIYQDYLDRTDPDGPKASERIADFLGQDYDSGTINRGNTQRIILIAARFRKEVTSTVLWLLNFKLSIKCFVATPYSMGDQHFLNIEQIIPTQDAEEFMIGIAGKSLDEVQGAAEEQDRHKYRREFWRELKRALEGRTSRFNDINPGPYGWFGAGSGVRGVAFNFGASRTYGRVEIYIDRDRGDDDEENKFIYDQLYAQKDAIQAAFGGALTWEPLEGRRACRIKVDTEGNISDRDQWPTMIEFMTNAMVKLENAFKEPLATISRKLQNRERAGLAAAAVPAEPIPEAAEGS
jgi:hypothetical protein